MFEATPDISRQMKALKSASTESDQEIADAIIAAEADPAIAGADKGTGSGNSNVAG